MPNLSPRVVFIGLGMSLDVERWFKLLRRGFALKLAKTSTLQSISSHLAMEFLLCKPFGYVNFCDVAIHDTSGHGQMVVNCFDLVSN